jgi:hypothetical protein
MVEKKLTSKLGKRRQNKNFGIEQRPMQTDRSRAHFIINGNTTNYRCI